MINKKGTSSFELFLGLVVILMGTFGSAFWGIGIAFDNNQSVFIGRILIALLPILTLIVGRFIK